MTALDEFHMTEHDSKFQLFDLDQDFQVIERRLPHWAQAGTICFITWRTWDSIPKLVLEQWLDERNRWLARHGINAETDDWKRKLGRLELRHRRLFHRRLANRWHDHLDACHGACVLRQRELAGIVAQSLHKFDEDRYELTDFIVMPNNIHILAAFPDEEGMLKQCESWKHFTATEINTKLGNEGRFWQQDGFDHLVRSLDQFEYYRRYIKDNPRRAGLKPGQFLHFSKQL